MIYDGPNDQSTQIAKLSGNLGSFSISSTGNSLFVKFESNSIYNDNGFFATIHHGNSCCIKKYELQKIILYSKSEYSIVFVILFL